MTMFRGPRCPGWKVPNGLLAGHGIEEILEDMATVAVGKLIRLSRQREAPQAQGALAVRAGT